MQEVQKHLQSELNGSRGHCVQSPENLCPSAQNDTAARSCSRVTPAIGSLLVHKNARAADQQCQQRQQHNHSHHLSCTFLSTISTGSNGSSNVNRSPIFS